MSKIYLYLFMTFSISIQATKCTIKIVNKNLKHWVCVGCFEVVIGKHLPPPLQAVILQQQYL